MIKVSYKKRYGENGTVYHQLIRIKDKMLIDQFNNIVKNELKRINDKRIITSCEMQKLAYLKPLSNGINYINLTTLSELLALIIQDYDYNTVKRIKYKNTVVIMEA